MLQASIRPVTIASIRIAQNVGDAPPPPLAGALAAWVLRAGGDVHVVDPRGAPFEPGPAHVPLYVHVDAGSEPSLDGLEWEELVLFGPGSHADPELAITPEAGLLTLDGLPLTTFAGFGRQAGAFRLLAGRGDRVRPVAAVIREIIYLVEMSDLGHVLFDDADLAAYGDWLPRFEAELAHLPWALTWQGTVAGARVRR